MDLVKAAPGQTFDEEEEETVTCTVSCEKESDECGLIVVFLIVIIASAAILGPYSSILF